MRSHVCLDISADLSTSSGADYSQPGDVRLSAESEYEVPTPNPTPDVYMFTFSGFLFKTLLTTSVKQNNQFWQNHMFALTSLSRPTEFSRLASLGI
jgi:hypothetical protein